MCIDVGVLFVVNYGWIGVGVQFVFYLFYIFVALLVLFVTNEIDTCH